MPQQPTAAQWNALAEEVTDWFAVGELAAAAGLPGGAQLQTDAADFLAFTAIEHGLDVDALPVFETGALGGAAQKAFNWLRTNSRRLIDSARRSQGLIITIGAVYIAHDWVTADKQIEIAKHRDKASVLKDHLNTLPPAKRAQILGTIAAGLDAGSGPGFGTIALVGLGAVAAYFIWRTVR